MSMTITDDNGRDNEVEIDDDLIDTDDERDDEPKPKNRQQPEPDTDDDDEEPEDGWAAEAKRLRAALKKSNATGLRRRNQLKALRAAESKADDDDDDDDDIDDDDGEEKPKQQKPAETLDARQVQRRVEKARKDERRRLEEEHRRDLIDTRAETALTRAGVPERYLRVLKKELDYDELELLKDRSVDGLEEEIDRLRDEFPDFFRSPKAARRRINGGDDRDNRKGRKTLSVNEQQLAKLRGTA